jgi:hypothetical protein
MDCERITILSPINIAVQIISDLNLEAPKAYDVFEIVPRAPYLAMPGDIGNVTAHKDEYLAFLTM